MKKKWNKIVLVGFFILGVFSISAQYTAIPDANFEQKLIDLGIDTEGTLDGQILTSDGTNNVWGLDLANSNISDLSGIEIFTNIATLNVQGNSLTSLNITSNTALKWLNCYDNMLTTLNTTGLTLLETINCKGNSISPTIDVSSSPNLTHLYCYSNQLKYLDLSNNTSLELLQAQTNNLGYDDVNALNMKNGNNSNVPTANFDIRWNWNTLCIDVDDVSYSNTNWTQYEAAHMSYSLDCANTTPVELLGFIIDKNQKGIILHWETASEINNLGFEVHKSLDGINWVNIGFVKAAINPIKKNEYKFIDENPPKSICYYRLKQIDLDGSFEFTNTLSFDNSQDNKLQIFPNPTSNKLFVKGIEFEDCNVIIYNIAGQVVANLFIQNNEIDISTLEYGLYYVEIQTNTQIEIFRIIKE